MWAPLCTSPSLCLRPAPGSGVGQDAAGTEQGAGGLPAADVHDQRGPSAGDRGPCTPVYWYTTWRILVHWSTTLSSPVPWHMYHTLRISIHWYTTLSSPVHWYTIHWTHLHTYVLIHQTPSSLLYWYTCTPVQWYVPHKCIIECRKCFIWRKQDLPMHSLYTTDLMSCSCLTVFDDWYACVYGCASVLCF